MKSYSNIFYVKNIRKNINKLFMYLKFKYLNKNGSELKRIRKCKKDFKNIINEV